MRQHVGQRSKSIIACRPRKPREARAWILADSGAYDGLGRERVRLTLVFESSSWLQAEKKLSAMFVSCEGSQAPPDLENTEAAEFAVKPEGVKVLDPREWPQQVWLNS